MMRWIVGSSLKLRFLVIAGAAAMLAFGAATLGDQPVDVFPEFAPPRVEVQTEGPGLSTTEVEELLTVPLEEALNGTPGLDVMRSKSVQALSSIELRFKLGTDIMRARQLVNERLALAIPTLPNAVSVPIMLPPLSTTSRAMFVGLSSKKVSMIEMSTIAFWTIRPRLLKVRGVANIALWGERLQQMQVHVDPKRMGAHDVSLDQVMEATADALEVGILTYTNSFAPGSGGWIDGPNQRFGVQHVLPIKYPRDLGQVPITVQNGKPLLLRDVSNVVEDHPPFIGDAVINDGPGVLLVVEKFPWANTLEVTRGVEKALDALRPGLPGIQMDSTIFRPATFIELSIHNLTRSLLIGAILVILILGAFLFEWRAALISVAAIPLSLVAAALVLFWRGETVNVMVLAGLVIALGAVVDDAIIDVENIVRRLRQHRKEGSDRSTASIILEASLEVRRAITYATLIIVLAVLPVFFLGGLSGAFFEPLVLSYALALLASMVVALTVTPALSLILLSKARIERHESPLLRWLQRGYIWLLSRIIRRPRPAFLATGVIMLFGFGAWPLLGQELLPTFKESDFLMHWVTTPGTSHPEAVRITTRASRELRSIPDVRNFGAHIGRALAADEVVGVNFSENWISVDPKADYGKTVDAIRETVEGYPGLVRDVQTYFQERVREVLTGTSEAIVVRIFGPELGVLRQKGAEVRRALSSIDGIIDLHTELQVDEAHIQIKVNLANAGRYGLKPGDVRRAAAPLLQGIEVGDIYRNGKAIDVAVWSTRGIRRNLTNIYDLLIDTPDGGHVRLKDVADVRVAPTPNVIKHEGISREIAVEANVRGRDLGSVARDIERSLHEIKFPLGYYPKLVGEFKERQAAQKRIFVFGLAAAIAIFLLLQAAFGSFRLATLSFLTLPFALVGGVLAALATGGVLSLGSLVGFLTVFGIAARNGIMMINHYQHLEQHEGEPFGRGLVLRGARERLAPIVMTSGALGLALVPLVVAGDIPGHEIEHPMAVVILGGLVTSTLLNLFLVPSLYLRFAKGWNLRSPRSVDTAPLVP
jgi:CzcA family heavy metal efflux pump